MRVMPIGAMTMVAAVVSACGGGGGAISNEVSSISGAVVKGPVDGAQVCVYALTDTGKGRRLGCTTSRSDGTYTLPIDFTGPVVVEASGGTYTDEATGDPGVSLSTPLTVVGQAQAGGVTMHATPLTALAYERARSAGSLSVERFDSAAGQVRNALGLSGQVDLRKTLPDVSAGSTNPYGEALIGVSKMIRGGATLSGMISNTDTTAVNEALSTCVRAPLESILWRTSGLPGSASVDVVVNGPHAAWRNRLPASGEIGSSGCAVEVNRVNEVRLHCSNAATVRALKVYAGGSATKYTFAPMELLSGDFPVLAGDTVTFRGAPLRWESQATVELDAGKGAIVVPENSVFSGVQSISMISDNIQVGSPCTVTPAGALSSSGTLLGGNSSGRVVVVGNGSANGWGSGGLSTGTGGNTNPGNAGAPDGSLVLRPGAIAVGSGGTLGGTPSAGRQN